MKTLILILTVFASVIALQAESSPADKSTDINTIRQKADAGDAKAQFELSNEYTSGEKVAHNDVLALKWLRKSAEQGYPDAEIVYGGTFAQSNPDEAVRWFRKAADQGSAAGDTYLYYYYSGNQSAMGAGLELPGIKVDQVEATKWLIKAIKDNNSPEVARAEIEDALAERYEKGLGVVKNDKEAARLLLKAANTGDRRAQYRLIEFYEKGVGVPQDDNEMIHWCRVSADNGDTSAFARLGSCYATGRGVLQDDVEAAKWYILATRNFLDSQYSKALEDIKRKLTADQIADAQNRAKQWREEHNNNSTTRDSR